MFVEILKNHLTFSYYFNILLYLQLVSNTALLLCSKSCCFLLHVPDVVNDEAGGGDEEVFHPVEVSADRLGVNCVVGDFSTGLIDHLNTSTGAGRCLTWPWWTNSELPVPPHVSPHLESISTRGNICKADMLFFIFLIKLISSASYRRVIGAPQWKTLMCAVALSV